MRIAIELLVLLLFLSLIGCVHTISVTPSKILYEKKNTFLIGQVQEKSVGDTMVFNLDVRGYKGFYMTETYQIRTERSSSYPYPIIAAGSEWAIIAENESYILLKMFPPLKDTYGHECCLIATPLGLYGYSSCSIDYAYIIDFKDAPIKILKKKLDLICKKDCFK